MFFRTVMFFVAFVIKIFVRSGNYDFHSDTELILAVHDFSKTSSVFLFYPDGETDGDNDLQRLTAMQAITKKLLDRGVRSVSATFSQLQKAVGFHSGKINPPLFVSFFASMNSIEQFQTMSKAMYMSFPKWLMIFMPRSTGITLKNFCSKPEENLFNFDFSTQIIVMCNNQSQLHQWNAVYDNQMKVTEFGVWTPENRTAPLTSVHFQDRRKNIDGAKFNITIFEDSIFIDEVNGELGGYFGMVFRELMQIMNFSVVHVFKKKMSDVIDTSKHAFSSHLPNGTIVLETVYSGEADVGLAGFGMTALRLKFVDFTLPLLISPDHLYIREPDESIVLWSAYFQAFEFKIWILIMAMTFILTFSIAFLKNKLGGRDFSLRSIFDIYVGVWGIFCQQSPTENSVASSLKIAYFSTFSTALIVYAIYSAFLISYLTIFIPSLPFSDLHGFTQDGSYKLIILDNSVSLEFFQYNNDTVIQRMHKLMLKTLPKSNIDGFKQVCQERVAFYVSEIVYTVMAKSIPCRLISITTGRAQHYAMILSKNSPYRRPLNRHIEILTSRGILKYLRHRAKIDPSHEPPRSFATAITLKGVTPILTILAGGVVLSVVVLCVEYLYFRIRQKISMYESKRARPLKM